MPTVTNIVRNAVGVAVPNATVTVLLITAGNNEPGFTVDGTVVGSYTTTTNGSGAWSIVIPGNSTITPNNTYYQVTETAPGLTLAYKYYISVPAAGGPYQVGSIRVLTPPSPSGTFVATSQAGVAGGYATLDSGGNVPSGQLGNVPAGTYVSSNSVVPGTTYGQAAAAGVATAGSRGDHTHGTPPPPYTVLVLSQGGTISASPGTARIYNDSGRALTIMAVRASAGTAPTGASLIVDIKKTGVTIFTAQANRPTIPIGANTSGKVTNMDVTALADGDYLTVDVAQVGSVVAGSDLVVQIWAS